MTIDAADLVQTAAVTSRLVVAEATGSTNADLVRASGEGWPHLSVLVTDDQRAGRGRLERSWAAPPGSSLACSVLLRVPELPAAARGWIPLAAGWAMAEAIAAQLPGHEAGLKWPNDVLVDGGKISGILAEVTPDGSVVVGMGVNTAMTAQERPVPTATSFACLGAQCDVDRLLSTAVSRLDSALTGLARSGSAVESGLHAAVSKRLLTLGRDVRALLPGGGELTGEASALCDDGRLEIRGAQGEHRVAAGDILHLRAR